MADGSLGQLWPLERMILDRFQRNLDLSLNDALSLDMRLTTVDSHEILSALAMKGRLSRIDRTSPHFAPESHHSLVNLMVSALKRYLYQRNQYLNIPQSVEEGLYEHYSEYVDSMVRLTMRCDNLETLPAELNAVVARHIRHLNSSLVELRSQMPSVTDGNRVRYLDYPCYQYSAELQMQVIGLENVKEPLLDIGCGWDATLVEHLRQSGMDAYGVDRSVYPRPYVYECDWFEFDFAHRSWGTVVSHMALSNHFIHSMVHEPARLSEFRSLFARVLHSLAPGGRLIYAPALPVIERSLPQEMYAIRTRPIMFAGAGFRVSVIEKKP